VHYYFKSTNGYNVARAENEILWWRGFTIEEVIRQGLAQMWRSGPSGEHYDIIVGPTRMSAAASTSAAMAGK
jgi:hypothetical protein